MLLVSCQGCGVVVFAAVATVLLHYLGTRGVVLARLERRIFPYRVVKEWSNGTCEVEGRIPPWLKGLFVRQVCGAFGDTKYPIVYPPMRLMHLFDCMPMAASYRFSPNKVTFSNKYYRTHSYKIWEHYNFNFQDSKIAWSTFFSPFDFGQYMRWKDEFTEKQGYYSGTASVEFWNLGQDHYAAVDESPHGLRIDINSLESLGPFPFQDNFEQTGEKEGFINNPAHVNYDSDGKVWSIIGHWEILDGQGRGRAHYIIYSIDGLSRREEGRHMISEFDLAACGGWNNKTYPYHEDMLGMLHSFAMTRNYIIIPESSYGLNYCGMLVGNQTKVKEQGSHNGLFYKYIKFIRQKPGKLLIFDKRSKQVVAQITLEDRRDGFFASHQLNAYEVNDTIIADMVTYKEPVYEGLTVDALIKGYPNGNTMSTEVLRFRVDTRHWSVLTSQIMPTRRTLEFPQINHDRWQKPYRFVYMVHNPSMSHSSIVKIDVDRGVEVARWGPETSVYPGEPVFVARPGGTREDDGVVVVGLTDANTVKGGVVVLEGKTLKELGRITAPELTPIGLHNWFYMEGAGRRSKAAKASGSRGKASTTTLLNVPYTMTLLLTLTSTLMSLRLSTLVNSYPQLSLL